MNFKQYYALIANIANGEVEKQDEPFNNPLYFNITKNNFDTMNNWLENGEINEQLESTLKKISKPQNWLVITEAWSADAAQSIPFIVLAAEKNPLINLEFELRDSEPHTINQYLTNGTKSIPKLIIRDENNNDIATWGARPEELQKIFIKLKEDDAPFEKLFGDLVSWYNNSKGQDFQNELTDLLSYN